MGQHRIQRQILQNFSFAGRQGNSRHVWWLSTIGYQPTERPIGRVGFFSVNCSEAVDDYITDLEDEFKNIVHRFGDGNFRPEDVERPTYNFIAMHYVRSLGFRRQIEYVIRECWSQGLLSQPLGEAEYKRLTAHQDVGLFDYLVDRVARVLTNYTLYPIANTGARSFVASDKIMYAGLVESAEQKTIVWFPLSSSVGLFLESDGHVGQILGPFVSVDRRSGRVNFDEVPEAAWLRCQEPTPHEVDDAFFDTVNGLMVQGSKELFSLDRIEIDAALKNAMKPSRFQYTPT